MDLILGILGGVLIGLGFGRMVTRVLTYPSDMMMRARIRAIQDRAIKCEKGVCFYNVQGANGKFARVMLPEVK